MLIYLISFAISLYGISVADKFYKRKIVFVFFIFVSLFPVVMLACLRDVSVGSDTEKYINLIFKEAVGFRGEFLEFRDMFPNFEGLILYIYFIIGKFTNSLYLLFLVLHLLVVVPIYIAAFKCRKSLSPPFFLFIYLLVFYNESLSIIRQHIALSFALLALIFLNEGKIFKYLLLTFLSVFAHLTALIAIIFPVIMFITKKFPIKKNISKYFLFVALSIVFFLNLESFIIGIVSSGYIDARYILYTFEGSFSGAWGLSNLFIKIIVVLYIIKIWKKYPYNHIVDFFLLVSIVDIGFSLCGIISEPLLRLSYYPRILMCAYIPYLVRNYPVRLYGKKLNMNFLFSYIFLFYWYYVYIHGDVSATSNYIFNL